MVERSQHFANIGQSFSQRFSQLNGSDSAIVYGDNSKNRSLVVYNKYKSSDSQQNNFISKAQQAFVHRFGKFGDLKQSHSRSVSRRIPYAGIGSGIGGIYIIGDASVAHAFGIWPFSEVFKKKSTSQNKILILMSHTGGGHKASAEAIRDGFKIKHGAKYEIDIVDPWLDYTPFPYNRLPRMYSFCVKHSFLWRLLFVTSNPKFAHRTQFRLSMPFVRRGISRMFQAYQPGLVVSVHPLLQHIPIRVLKDLIRSSKVPPCHFATVVTDFTTCHNTWFHKSVRACFVPTEHCKRLALRNGLRESQLIMHGLPIRPSFSRQLGIKAIIRRKLGIQNMNTVLIVGGGEGMGSIQSTVNAIKKNVQAQCQLLVVCGTNKSLQQQLKSQDYPDNIVVQVFGFVSNMHEIMEASDAIITKAGPGTIAESLVCGLPILLNGNVPCQEEGNIPYVVDNRVGTFETNPTKIAGIIEEWMGEGGGEVLKGMSERAKALGKPKALFQIVEDLAGMVKEHGVEVGFEKAVLA